MHPDQWRRRDAIVVLALLAVTIALSTPAFAEVDFSGEWGNRLHEDQTYRGPGPEIGEYLGLPINDAARMKADSWDAAVYSLPERQCIPFAADHGLTIGNMRMWKEVDPSSQTVIAWHEHHEWQAQERTIWMDGRPHPPEYAAHTWQGFSTGSWEGDILTVTTTHLKMAQIERNGVPRSDEATMVERYIRHGEYLTIVQTVADPVYLTEPFVRSRNYVLTPSQQMGGYSCRPAVEIPDRKRGYVPHHLPGTNPFRNNAAVRLGAPAAALRGGAETQYPEYQLVLNRATKESSDPVRSAGGGVPPQMVARTRQPPAPGSSDRVATVSILPVQGSVYMVVGAGANITVQVGDDAVLVVDTGLEAFSDDVLGAIRRVSSKPIRFVVNTGGDTDHAGGNAPVAAAGRSISGNNRDGTALLGDDAVNGAAVIAHENVLKRMTKGGSQTVRPSVHAWPTETFITRNDELFNGEGVRIVHEPAAHSDGDSIVFFRRSDVISAGDVFSTVSYPVVDRQAGGSINGIIDALNDLIDLAIPRDKQEGGTYIIPGHGRLCDEADVVEYRDMVTIIRDRVQDMIKRGMTLEQIQAARPTMDYDPRYGSAPGWTSEMFVEAVYRGLGK